MDGGDCAALAAEVLCSRAFRREALGLEPLCGEALLRLHACIRAAVRPALLGGLLSTISDSTATAVAGLAGPSLNLRTAGEALSTILQSVADGQATENSISLYSLLKKANNGCEGTANELTDDEVSAALMRMVEAGRPLLKAAIASVLWVLAGKAALQEQLAGEVAHADATHGSASGSMRALASLQLCSRFLKETLRLFPPLVLCPARVAEEDMQVSGQRFLAGDTFACPILALHHSEGLWESPENFDTERFESESAADQPHCAFMPFGHGPFTCPAQRLAMVTLKVLLVVLLRKHRLRRDAGDPPFQVEDGTLLPLPGTSVVLQRL